MRDTSLNTFFAGKGAATSLLTSLALHAAVLISVSFTVVLAIKASIVSMGGCYAVERVATRAGNSITNI